MRTENIIGLLLKQHDISKHSVTSSFRPGEFILGRVTKFFQNDIAEVQIGTQKMIAKLEAPLTAGIPYWFQIQSVKGQVHLKVIEQSTSPIISEQTSSAPILLNQLKLPQSEEYRVTVEHFIKEQLPVTKELIHNAALALKGLKNVEEGLQAVKQLVLKGLPITKDILEATIASNKQEPLYQMLNKLQALLTESPVSTTGERLHSFIQQLKRVDHGQANTQYHHINEGQSESINWEDRGTLIGHIKKLTTMIGFDNERQLDYLLRDNNQGSIERQETLKSLLLKFIDENPPKLYKESAEQLLQKVTGLQLLSQDSGYYQQYVIQVPLSFLNKNTDLTVQWSGRKKENGQIDSNHCRILFYLELEHINEVVVDLQIQNRILNVNIYNETVGIKVLAEPFVTSLKDKLKELDYQLSSVVFHNSKHEKIEKQKNHPSIYDTNHVHGVDIKI